MKTLPVFIAILGLMLFPQATLALPAISAVSATDGESTLTFSVSNQTIAGDSVSWCRVRIQVGNQTVPFSMGDTIALRVYKDLPDPAFDTVLWNTEFHASNNCPHDRTFDCSSGFQTESGTTVGLYAAAEINKEECGFACFDDNPVTEILSIPAVEDDAREPDNSMEDAAQIDHGLTGGGICRDADWTAFELETFSNLTVQVLHDPGAGRLNADLFDGEGTQIASGTPGSSDTTCSAAYLVPGVYYLRVLPADAQNFNFYDVQADAVPIDSDCVPGDTSSELCGNCGYRHRACDEYGDWGGFGDCGDEDFGSTTCGEGVCENTTPNCVDGAPAACEPLDASEEETCDGLDNNCDGETDENGVCEADGDAPDGDVLPDGDGVSDGDSSADGDHAVDGDGAPDGDVLPDGDGVSDGDSSADGDHAADGDGAPDGDETGDGDASTDGDEAADGDAPDGEETGSSSGGCRSAPSGAVWGLFCVLLGPALAARFLRRRFPARL